MKVVTVLVWVIPLAFIIAQMIYVFKHPDMTTTRVFLNTWENTLAITAACIYLMWYYHVKK